MEQGRIIRILELLDENYGRELTCHLEHENVWQLLFATILSAQCTDARVNMVTRELYKKYPSVAAFAKAELRELEQDIYTIGFYHSKAKNIIACARIIEESYGGRVPEDMAELKALPGVGRKTANVIRGNAYKIPCIVVDTHVKRISKRLGLTNETDPEKIEYDLMKKLPKEHWILYNIQIIDHGRSICKAIKPNCDGCFLKEYCPTAGSQAPPK